MACFIVSCSWMMTASQESAKFEFALDAYHETVSRLRNHQKRHRYLNRKQCWTLHLAVFLDTLVLTPQQPSLMAVVCLAHHLRSHRGWQERHTTWQINWVTPSGTANHTSDTKLTVLYFRKLAEVPLESARSYSHKIPLHLEEHILLSDPRYIHCL